MTLIDIQFVFGGQEYKSKVHRIGSGPVQYHLLDVEPELEVKNKMYIWNYKTSQLEYAVDPNHRSLLEAAIAEGIFEACNREGIDISAY